MHVFFSQTCPIHSNADIEALVFSKTFQADVLHGMQGSDAKESGVFSDEDVEQHVRDERSPAMESTAMAKELAKPEIQVFKKQKPREYRYSNIEVNLRSEIVDLRREVRKGTEEYDQHVQDKQVERFHNELKHKIKLEEKAHLEAKVYYQWIYYGLMMVTMFFSTLNSFSIAAQTPLGVTDGALKVLVLFISAVNGFTQGLLGLCKAQSKMDAHDHSASHYGKILLSLDMTIVALSAASLTTENLLDRIDYYKDKMEDAQNSCAFPLPKFVKRRLQARFAEYENTSHYGV